MLNYTDEQQTIIAEVPDRVRASKSTLIEARAGAGKTFILSELAPALPAGGKCLAFNKSIAVELAARLPSTCPSSTFHALGLSILRDRLSTFQTDSRKLQKIADKMRLRPSYPYTQCVSALKINGCGLGDIPAPDLAAIQDIIDLRGIDLPQGVDIITFSKSVIKLFTKSIREMKTIDFDDMLYLPVYLCQKYSWKMDAYPYLLIDEAQDVSPLRLMLIELLTKTVIAVGDPYQSIYGFAGAMGSALDEIRQTYDAETYPLSYSFRCPDAITRHASELISPAEILSLPNHIGGLIADGNASAYPYPQSDREVVLCRTNAPLFVMALRMLRDNRPVNFNSDFPRQIIAFMKKFKAKTQLELKTRLASWFDEQTERFESGAMRKTPYMLAKEKHDTLMYLTLNHETPEAVIVTLTELMTPNPDSPTLSTIHKAKGLEWPLVYLLRPDLLPAPFASTPEELEQERNLEYVAVTRATTKFTRLWKEG